MVKSLGTYTISMNLNRKSNIETQNRKEIFQSRVTHISVSHSRQGREGTKRTWWVLVASEGPRPDVEEEPRPGRERERGLDKSS
jgi:hypothetical protein